MGQLVSESLGGGVTAVINDEKGMELHIVDDNDKLTVVPWTYGTLCNGRLDFIIEQLNKLRPYCVEY